MNSLTAAVRDYWRQQLTQLPRTLPPDVRAELERHVRQQLDALGGKEVWALIPQDKAGDAWMLGRAGQTRLLRPRRRLEGLALGHAAITRRTGSLDPASPGARREAIRRAAKWLRQQGFEPLADAFEAIESSVAGLAYRDPGRVVVATS